MKLDVLIGRDFYYEFVSGVTKKESKGYGPVAILTKVGWGIRGQVLTSQSSQAHANVATALTLKYTENVICSSNLFLEYRNQR